MNIVVIGGSNVDIYGRVGGPLRMKDSNPGTVLLSCGGVGRNIFENLARLKLKPRFITAIGDDQNGHDLVNKLTTLGVEVHAKTVPGAVTPTYLAILDASGELVAGVNDMAALKALDAAYLKKNTTLVRWIREADIIVADTNIDETVLAYLAFETKKPLYVDGISAAKAIKLLPILHRITVLKCARREAEALIGKSDVPIEIIGKTLVAKGIQEVYLTDGANGSYLFEAGKVRHQRALPTEIVSASGAGDAFFAGVIYAKASGKDPLAYGAAAAQLTLHSEGAVHAGMSPEQLAIILETNP